MPYDGVEPPMSKREPMAREVDRMSAFRRSLRELRAGSAMPTLAAESSLAKDWLTPEEDAAWASL